MPHPIIEALNMNVLHQEVDGILYIPTVDDEENELDIVIKTNQNVILKYNISIEYDEDRVTERRDNLSLEDARKFIIHHLL